MRVPPGDVDMTKDVEVHLTHVGITGGMIALEDPRFEGMEREQQEPADIVMPPSEGRIGAEPLELLWIDAGAQLYFFFGVQRPCAHRSASMRGRAGTFHDHRRRVRRRLRRALAGYRAVLTSAPHT